MTQIERAETLLAGIQRDLKMRQMRKYRDYLIEELSDPEEAIVYLEVSIEEYQKDGDTVAFLIALQSIAEAQAENNEIASQVYLLSGGIHLSRRGV